MEGRDAPADGVVTGYGRVDGRMVAVCAYDFTVMAGAMGMTGELKVTRLRELALTHRDPVRVAARLRRRADPGGGRLAVRRLRPPVPRGGRDERGDPAGGGADGPVRGRHGLHPGAGRLRPDGARARVDGAGRSASRARGDRRGRQPGGAGRLARALPQVRRGRHRGGLATRSASRSSSATCPTSRRTARSGRRSGRSVDPLGPHGRGAARRAAGHEPQAVRHVRRDPPDRRRGRVARREGRLGAHDHHVPGADGRPAGRDRREPAAGTSAGSSTTTRPTRRRGS